MDYQPRLLRVNQSSSLNDFHIDQVWFDECLIVSFTLHVARSVDDVDNIFEVIPTVEQEVDGRSFVRFGRVYLSPIHEFS